MFCRSTRRSNSLLIGKRNGPLFSRCSFSTTIKFEPPKFAFQIIGSAVVERVPIIFPEIESWKRDYYRMLWNRQADLEPLQEKVDEKYIQEVLAKINQKDKSKVKEKEKGKKKEKQETKTKKKKDDDDEETSSSDEDKARKMEERTEKVAIYSEYPRITPDDESNNRRSMYRKLDRRLYLIVKKGNEGWCFPQQPHLYLKDGANLRKTAHRTLLEECGPTLDVHFEGNSPIGFWSYPSKSYPFVASTDETKVFFFKAQYVFGPVKLSRKAGLVDFAWVTRDELQEYIPDSKCHSYLHKILNY